MLLEGNGKGGAPAWSSLSPSSRVMSGWMLCGGNTNKNIINKLGGGEVKGVSCPGGCSARGGKGEKEKRSRKASGDESSVSACPGGCSAGGTMAGTRRGGGEPTKTVLELLEIREKRFRFFSWWRWGYNKSDKAVRTLCCIMLYYIILYYIISGAWGWIMRQPRSQPGGALGAPGK